MALGKRDHSLIMLRVERETLAALRDDPALASLILEYQEEAGSPLIAPDPDWGAMAALEKDDALLCMIARIDGGVVGFAVWRLFCPLGFRRLRVGFAEFLFLSAQYRAYGGARRLIAASENAMRAKGVMRAAIHDALDSPHDFGMLGYAAISRVWLKDLAGVSRRQQRADCEQ